MADNLLDIRDLTLHYGSSQILNGISLTARQGEVTCVMGTNGVGKTSLLKAISGTHPRSGGAYFLDGAEMDRASAHRLAQLGVAYVPQGREIFPFLTVRENLETGFACLPKGDRHLPDEVFELFPILKDFMARRGGDLSGGQQQQLAIARALVTRPKLLLLDEPTEGIQPNIIKHIGTVIKALRDRGDMA
ncbi:MAG: ATP-binding cassette domain-containing protein, partial [Sulfitobacter sp.]|nr:ATP-binding cassette domain-containing protein [Sulfitobacter sp.]